MDQLDARSLFALLGPETLAEFPEFSVIAGSDMPEPYRGLLVHKHHMTVTVEAFHQCKVDLHVLSTVQKGELYGRKILLAREGTNEIVQFGIVQINLDACDSAVRDEILNGQTPLGRVLIEHEVLRQIEPRQFLTCQSNDAFSRWFGLTKPTTLYGRLGLIYCNNVPAIEVLEVVRPEL